MKTSIAFFPILRRVHTYITYKMTDRSSIVSSAPLASRIFALAFPSTTIANSHRPSAGANNVPRQMGDVVRAEWLLDRPTNERTNERTNGRTNGCGGGRGALRPQVRIYRSLHPYHVNYNVSPNSCSSGCIVLRTMSDRDFIILRTRFKNEIISSKRNL